MAMEISMLTAFILTTVILISGGARTYFRHKFDVSEEFKLLNDATRRHSHAKQRLHNVQH